MYSVEGTVLRLYSVEDAKSYQSQIDQMQFALSTLYLIGYNNKHAGDDIIPYQSWYRSLSVFPISNFNMQTWWWCD